MNLWQNYLCPSNVQEALLALRDAPPPTIPIAGGTDILLDLEQGRHPPAQTLVDLTSVVEMTALETRGNELFVGSAVPLARVAAHPLVIQQAEALAEACELVGGLLRLLEPFGQELSDGHARLETGGWPHSARFCESLTKKESGTADVRPAPSESLVRLDRPSSGRRYNVTHFSTFCNE